MSRWVGAVFLLGGLSALGFGCGGEDAGDVAGGGALPGTGATGGSGGGSGGSGGGGSTCKADGDCDAGTFCSAAGSCIATGTCAADGDCDAGSFCGVGKKCIPTGTCAADGDCGAGLVCDPAQKTCVPGGGCGAEEFTIEAVAPNLFISLDRSCSMTSDGGGGKTKWVIAVDALNKMLTTYSGKIRWGLGLFPDITGNNCTQDAAQFAVADANEAKIQALLTASLAKADKFFPDGPCVTNIDTAMQQASLEPAFKDKTRKSYVLLITDGKQAGCNAAGGDPGTEQIIKQLNTGGVSTFVIGFGTGVDPAQMNAFALAGGVPSSDPTTKYYQANDATSLGAALGKIAGTVASCSFTLGKTPADPSKVFVFFDNAKVPQDKTQKAGWDYDATTNQITFYGADCDKIKAQTVKDVDVVFGCDQPTPG
ncbi:MAG: VWA domain-containing protein [Myxococcales bacterium]|nr:VWA domain-containing protein [Myxococcales bacterium]